MIKKVEKIKTFYWHITVFSKIYIVTIKKKIIKKKSTKEREKRSLKILKDTHREKAPTYKIPVLKKSMNMDIWVVGTSKQLFKKGS